MIRYLPGVDFNGQAFFTFRVWDGTSDTSDNNDSGEVIDTSGSKHGGSTAYSNGTVTAAINVSGVNDAPEIHKYNMSNALEFDGSNDYVKVPDLGLNNDSFTVEGWIKVDSANTYSRFFDFGGDSIHNDYGNHDIWGGFSGSDGVLKFEVWSGTDRNSVSGISAPISDKFPLHTWVYVSFVYNHAAQMGYIYQNGELKQSGTLTLDTAAVARTCSYFGRSNWTADAFFDGRMRNIAVWKEARTANEISLDMNTGFGGSEPNLVLYYPLDDAASSHLTTIHSVTGRYNGSLYNYASIGAGEASTANDEMIADDNAFDYQVSGVAGENIPINALFLKDVDAGAAGVTVTLSTSKGGKLAVDPTNGTGVTGNNSASLNLTGTIDDLNTALKTLTYQLSTADTDAITATVNDGVGASVSQTIGVTVINAPSSTISPKIITQPVSQAVPLGGSAGFSITANKPENGNNITYQWQVSKDGGLSWSNVNGTDSGTGSACSVIGVTAGDNGNQYRCVVSNMADLTSVTSNNVTLTVTYPILKNMTPDKGATGVAAGTLLTMTFNENINGVDGKYINIVGPAGVECTIPITDSNVNISNNIVTVTLPQPLSYSTKYYILIDNGAFKDQYNNNYNGISDNTTWSFTTDAAPDTTAPVLINVSPANNAGDVAVNTKLIMTFSEDVYAVHGKNIIVRDLSGIVYTIPADDGNVVINDNIVTVTLPGALGNNKNYSIIIDNNAFKDISGNPYDGITETTEWAFKTCKADCTTVKGIPPVLQSKTDITILLQAVDGYEYAIVAADGDIQNASWQDSNEFPGLTPNTQYDTYQRVAETSEYKASEISEALRVTSNAQLSILSDGHGTASAAVGGNIVTSAAAGDTVTLTATPDLGYHFTEWQVISGGITVSGSSFTMPSSDVVINAVFEADSQPQPGDTHTVTVTSSGNGTATASTDSAAAGDTVTLTATPDLGYHFSEWQVVSGGITVSGSSFTMPSSDVIINAVFESDGQPQPGDTHTVTVTSSGNGTATASADSAAAGDTVTLTATPDLGYHFAQWQVISGGITITGSSITMPASDVVINAVFEADSQPQPEDTYTVTVTNSGNGTATASADSAAAGDTVTLTATPDLGYHFAQWQVVSGEVIITGNSFAMPSSDVEIKAVFEADVLHIRTIAANPGSVNFGISTTGYDAPPSAQTVAISNTGNQSINLIQPTSERYNIGPLSTTVIEPGETAVFSVQPKNSLTAGNYNETITINGSDGVSTIVSVKFQVTDPIPDTGSISGTVTDDTQPDSNKLESVIVTVKRGEEILGTMTTGTDGVFIFANLPYGIYSLVATKEDQIITKIIVIDKAETNGDIIMPVRLKNTVVITKESTPAVAVDGLNELFGQPVADQESGVTQSDLDTVDQGGTVKIVLTAEKKEKEEVPEEVQKIQNTAGADKELGLIINLTIQKEVTPSGGSITTTTLTELPDMLKITIELPDKLQGRTVFTVLRIHNGITETISPTNNGGEYYEVDGKYLILHVNKFSIYAIAYNKSVDGGNNPEGNNPGGNNPGGDTPGRNNSGDNTAGDNSSADNNTGGSTPDGEYGQAGNTDHTKDADQKNNEALSGGGNYSGDDNLITPKTGDDSRTVQYIGMMLLFSMLELWMMKNRKKIEKHSDK